MTHAKPKTEGGPPRRLAPLSQEDLELIVDDPLALELRDDANTVVPAIPHQTFSAIVRALRDEGRLDLVIPHATPEQLTAYLDLNTWERDRVDVLAARDWLAAISAIYEQAPEIRRGALARLIYAMDPEMWTMALLPGTSVLELDPDDDEVRERARDAVDDLHTYETPDGLFLVAVPDNDAGHQAVEILERVYQDSLAEGRNLVNSLRGALATEIEDQLYQWRNGRLMDLGFVPWEEAMKLFRPLDVRAAASRKCEVIPAPGLRRDEVLLEVFQRERDGLLRRVLESLATGERGLRLREFTLLVNEVMSAQRFDLGDPERQARAVHQTHATVSLGLELLIRHARAIGLLEGDEDAAIAYLASRVEAIGLRAIFQVGYGPLDKLRRAAGALHREGRISLDKIGSLLDRPWGPTIAALARWYPELPVESNVSTLRPIANLGDVARATERITEAGALAILTFDPAGYDVDSAWVGRVDEPGRLCLGDLLRAAIIHGRLPGAGPKFAPLGARDLAWARDHLLVHDGDKPRLAPSIRVDFTARAAACGVSNQANALADTLLPRLEYELATLERDDAEEPDLTRVGGMVTVQQVGVWLKTGAGAA